MDFIDLIIKKRNKETLTKEEINFFVQGVTNKNYTWLSNFCNANGNMY